MRGVRAFQGMIVNPARADEVVAPAYDSLTPGERARYADSHPDNFLNVMRTREDYPDAEMDAREILERNRSNLERMLATDCFVGFDRPAMFIYRLAHGDHAQTGLVAELPIAEVDRGAVLKHEQTRRDREDLLVKYQRYVGATSSPVALAYRARSDICAMKRRLAEDVEPALDMQSADGVRQTLWQITEPGSIKELRDAFDHVPVSYLTDGHHRTAAASRFAAAMRREGRVSSFDESWNHMLVVLFPHDELRVLPFNRVVRDLGRMSERDFLERVADAFEVETLDADPDAPPAPDRAGSFLMVLDDRCFRITARSAHRDSDDPAESLDVTVLQRRILEPILGISDSRGEARLEYVSGSSGRAGVNALREAGWRLAFYCHPATVEDIMTVSDAGGVMPPKSTCFEPKVRSGLFLRLSGEMRKPRR